ncbi:hypothetical protein Tco_0212814 [Tanacetum coccineum]
MPTEMELTLEQTQQGVSYEVSLFKMVVGGYPHDSSCRTRSIAHAHTRPQTYKHHERHNFQEWDEHVRSRSLNPPRCKVSNGKRIVLLISQDAQDHNANTKIQEQAQSKKSMITTTIHKRKPYRNDHIPKVNLKHDWWKPLSEEDRLATPEPAWSIPSSDLPVPTYNWASALASTYAPPP